MRRYHFRRSTTSFFLQIWLRWPCRAEGRDFKTSGKLGCGVWDFWMVKCRVFIQYISQKFSAKYLQKIWVDERFHPLRSLGCLSSANAVYVTRFVGLLWPGHCNWCTHRGGGIEAQILFARIGFNVCIRDRLDRAVLFLGLGRWHFSIFLIEMIRIFSEFCEKIQ